jgi:hypothetical protein
MQLDNDYFITRKGYFHPFRKTRVPFTIKLDEARDPLDKQKVSLMMNRFDQRTFLISDKLNDE